MDEKSKIPKEAQVFNFSDRQPVDTENRKREVARLLLELGTEIGIAQSKLVDSTVRLRYLSDLPVLGDPNINDNTVDLGVVRQNLKIRGRDSGRLPHKEMLVRETRKLIIKVRDTISVFYDTKFKKIMRKSNVMSEAEINFDYTNAKFREYKDSNFQDSPTAAALELFFTDFRNFFTDLNYEVLMLGGMIKDENPSAVNLEFDLKELRNHFQTCLKYAQYFLNMFNKNFPPK